MDWRRFNLWAWFWSGLVPVAAAVEANDEFFERRIRPVLVEHCFACHSATADKLKASLRVDSREGLLRGGETGPAVVPGDPEAGLLLRALSYDDPDLQMPPRSRLPEEVVADFQRWIADGATWPGAAVAEVARARGGFDVARRRAEHWAWQPVRRPEVPSVQDTDWPRTEVDRFILAGLERAGLRPADRASRSVWVRRASYVLTGLPPSPAEVEDFVADTSPLAEERLLDRWLGSVHFGERWARHWLDKVRYAETMGHEFDYPIEGAWRYRDYVVRAFNGDVPYDRFTQEHIAGDLLPGPARRAPDGSDEGRLATAQYWFCQQVHSPVDARQQQAEVIDNQIDVVTKAFLGMTVSCARCHDHKFDAISTRDYYALYGVLGSSRYALRAVDDPGPRLRRAEALKALRDEVRHALADRLEAVPSVTGPVSFEGISGSERREGDRWLDLAAWMPDGEAFELDGAAAGQPVMLGTNRVVVLPPGWRHSASLSARFQGALRSPTFVLDADYLHLWVAGEGARFTLAVEGFTLVRAPIYGALRQAIRGREPHWMTVDVSMWRGRQAWLEFADLAAPDPATTLPGETLSPTAWGALGGVVLSAHREPPGTETTRWTGEGRERIRRWRTSPGTLTAVDVAWLTARLDGEGIVVPEDLQARWAGVEAGIDAPVLAGGMTDGTGVEEPVFIRGNPRTPGEVVPRRFLEAISVGPGAAAFREGSGRLALAEAITHPDNPLFDRVLVNWVWSHLFGRGLVASVDNFGVLGDPPTHPELLDWLADEFRGQGRSVKRLIRSLMLTETWRMSSRRADADPAAEDRDPANRLWHRAELRRLEGEAIRDAILAVSGRLDRTVGGPPVPVHLTPFMEGRGRPGQSGPLDGAGRRSLYQEVRRNFLPPLMLAFDAPQPATTVGRRSVSNVPAQSLALMNDPLVAGQARFWAERVLRETEDGAETALRRLFLEAFGRAPTADEMAAVASELGVGPGDGQGVEFAVWGEFCHALFNAKEFIFVE